MKSNVEHGRRTFGRRRLAVTAPLALLFVLALPAAAAARQWTTSGTNTTTTNNVSVGTTTADRVFTVQGQVIATGTPMAVVRTTGTVNGSGFALDATGTGNNNLGFHVSGARKAAISWDNARNFLGLLNAAYSDNDFALRLNNNGSLTFHDGANGTERIRFTTGGYVGIGTATPGYPLTVRATTNIAPLNMVGGTGNLEIWKDATPTKAVAFGSALPGLAAGDDIQLSTYNGTAWASRLTILNSNGNVGIGMTPGASYKLDVAGNVNASGLCLSDGCRATWAQVTGGGGTSPWATSGSNVYYSGGNVGIGTNAPSQMFQVHSPGAWAGMRVTTAATGATFNDGVNVGYDDSVGAYFWNREASALVFAAGNAERMRVDSGGNVGIGTSAPGKKLDVAGSIFAGSSISLGKGGSTYAGIGFNRDVDVGTILNPSYAAHQIHRQVNGNKLFFSVYNGAGTLINYPLVIDEGGQIGIGTETPTAKLDVTGNVNVTGSVNASGSISAKYQDVAEWVPSTQKLAAGTVVVLDTRRPNHVLASTTAYDTRVAGVVSAQPGILLGEAGEGKALVATTGRVKVRVDATRAPIRIGDLIVTSDAEGVGMRSEPVALGGRQFHAPGTIIGKALEPLASGTGEILVLLSLQ